MSRRAWVGWGLVLAAAIAIRIWVGAPLVVYTQGMSPNVAAGDLVWVRYRAPRVGEVVRARMDAGEAPQLVRMVAGPGQTVEVSGGVLYVDGMPAALGTSRHSESCGGQLVRQVAERWNGGSIWVTAGEAFEPVVVSPGSAWLMGDNRLVAGDSQRWGEVSQGLIDGVATTLLWPSTSCGSLRWPMLGKRIM